MMMNCSEKNTNVLIYLLSIKVARQCWSLIAADLPPITQQGGGLIRLFRTDLESPYHVQTGPSVAPVQQGAP